MNNRIYHYYGFAITRTIGLKNGKKSYFYDGYNKRFKYTGFRNKILYIGLYFNGYTTLYEIKEAIRFAVYNFNIAIKTGAIE